MRHDVILLGLVVLAGCTDQGPLTPQQKAEAYFDDNVYEVLVQDCASCHTTAGVVFMGTDPGSTYVDLTNSTLVQNFSSTAPFITTMQAGSHFNQPSPTAMAAFEEWFSLERAARGD